MQAYLQVFGDAAIPQKLLLLSLALAAILTVVVTARKLTSSRKMPPPFIEHLAFSAPALGIATAALDARHMMGTVLRLPGDVGLKALAPGLMEMSALVQAGAAVGLLAVAAGFVLDVRRRRPVQA